MAALGDDVAQDLVGPAAESHQRGGPVEPFELSSQRRPRAAVGQQAVGPEQSIARSAMRWRSSLVKIFSTLTSTVGMTPLPTSTLPRSPSAWRLRRRLRLGRAGAGSAGLSAGTVPSRRGCRASLQIVECAAQVPGVGQRAAFQVQRAGDVGPAAIDLADEVGRPEPGRRGRTPRWCGIPTRRTAGGSPRPVSRSAR